ncbi:cytochrome P450 [Kallotenue papyrolyticum]|uniref:cytochrome P450 n=1 Tax=Kallotenue papyrolyticum TaxID=1325125 RepID=UPI00049247F7|nr:cytochrome P450 [Kallotenue papyrolyticum]
MRVIEASSSTPTTTHQHRCPFHHQPAAVDQKTALRWSSGAALEGGPDGVWRVRDYRIARQILKSEQTRQAGFRAELLEHLEGRMRPPVLFQEGPAHHEQRRKTARFFTPKTVSSAYRGLMETLADELIGELQRRRRVDLSRLSMRLAVQVAAHVVGLTNSRLPGMDRRIDAFFAQPPAGPGRHLGLALAALRNQWRISLFYLLDVKPAIRVRRQQPREDVISHLIGQGYRDHEILTECITYGAAGMATTREFISIAAWHMLEQPALRARYLAADEAERHAILQELLRLEPVVGNLLRRATADLQVETEHGTVTIPAGALIDLQIHAANADESAVGAHGRQICLGRDLKAEGITPAGLSFGDGHHRCPGAYVAIQESDIFLQRLLALDGLRIIRPPTLTWNELIKSYEVRTFIVALS